MWTRFRNKLRHLLLGRRFDEDLAQELDFHRDMLIRDEQRLGRSREAAVLNARRKMGNTALMQEYSRDAWIIGWIDTLVRDVRYALRSFARNPGFTLVAVLTMALGIGANTAIFRLVDAVLLRSLPVERPRELLSVRGSFSYWRFEQIRDRNEIFTDTVGIRIVRDVNLAVGDQAIGTGAAEMVTGNYFSVLGVRPVLGRPIVPDDDVAAGAGPVAVIGYGLWQRAFAASPDAIGRPIRLRGGMAGGGTSGFEPDAPNAPKSDEAVLTIVGVAPPEFFGDTVGQIVDVWLPITMQPVLMPGRRWLTRRSASWVNILGRRRPGVSEQQASESLTLLNRRLIEEERGASLTDLQRREIASSRVIVDSGERGFTQLRRQFSQPLLVLMTVVTLVLLIACLNVANLMLARATARHQEIAMRLSLGASRWRLVRQLLTESLLLAVVGGALGLALATIGANILVAMVSGDAQGIALRLDPDRRILLFTAGVSITSGLLSGLIPALQGTRRGIQHGLREMRSTSGARRKLAAKALVAVQIAVSLVLLVGCGLFLRTLYNLKTSTLGYDPAGLVMVRVDPVAAGYRGEEIGRAIVALMHRLAALPDVKAATFSENGLFGGVESGTSIEIPGFTPSSDDDTQVRFDQAGPGFFTHAGIPLLMGRDFTEQDRPGAPRVAIINDAMARFYFPNENPIGRRIRVTDPSDNWLEVVGVARYVQDHDLRLAPLRRIYVSYLQPIDGIVAANLAVRAASAAGAPALLGPIREEIQRFNPGLPILSLKRARTLVDDSILTERLIARLSTVFGALAALLAAIGLYGVMSYTVARRTSEIGVRMALGARQSAIAGMILREILVLVAIGSAAGAAAALGLARFVESLVFGLRPRDPITVAVAIALLLLIGLLAGYLPARRAARIDPLAALRTE
jgi:predicted permease